MLFEALKGGDAPRTILQVCLRMRDDFPEYWLTEYPTPEELGSDVSKSCLATTAGEARDNTARVEVRHGQFYREMQEKSLHVTPAGCSLVSAVFLMYRQRDCT